MQPKDGARVWRYYCEDCSDTANRSVWCNRAEGSEATRKPWQDVLLCPKAECPYPHEWIARCGCFYTNPAPAIVAKRIAAADAARDVA